MILELEQDVAYQGAIARVRDRVVGRGMHACVITFGCQQNEADSEKIRALACEMGYCLTDDTQRADLIIVNTCAIRAHAEMKVLSLLGTFRQLKVERPSLVIGVVGCMAAEQTVVNRLRGGFKHVSFTAEPNMLHRLPLLILEALEEQTRTFLIGTDVGDLAEGLPVQRTHRHKAYVSVMYGCNNFCSYCIVPYVRGRERSRDSAAILAECEGLVRDGCREITLLGQNVNSYRSDTDFAGLITRIAQIPGDFIIRFMTSHPKDVSDGLIRAMQEHGDKIAPYFHLPIQSGSDPILRRMNRTYNGEKYRNVVRRLREAMPHIALSTDVIVGFPGESEEDFEATLAMLREVRYDLVYAFRYSPREGTRAAAMPDQIPETVKAERLSRLLALQDGISMERSLALLGQTVRVLVDEVGADGVATARTPGNKLVHFRAPGALVGEFCTVRLTEAAPFTLRAEPVADIRTDNKECVTP